MRNLTENAQETLLQNYVLETFCHKNDGPCNMIVILNYFTVCVVQMRYLCFDTLQVRLWTLVLQIGVLPPSSDWKSYVLDVIQSPV
jgi:hypothetical protein